MNAASSRVRQGASRIALWSTYIAWICGLSSIALTWFQARYYVYHPHYLPLTILLTAMMLATFLGFSIGLYQTIRGPHRSHAVLIILAILPPVGLWAYIGMVAQANSSRRWVPNTFAMRTAKVLGVTLMRMEADLFYRQRIQSDRIVMYYDPIRSPYVESVDRPEEDLAAMDRHLARLEEVLGESIHEKVFWIRGPVLGSSFLSLHGLALGSAWSPEILDSYRGDRHELAHAALDAFRLPTSDPPYVLHEGWAMAQCGDSQFELAKAATEARAKYPQLSLRELFDREWYYQDSGPVYSIGGAFVDFLIRKYDAKRFRKFYTECTPDRVDAACREIFQVEFDALESEFWSDVDHSQSINNH